MEDCVSWVLKYKIKNELYDVTPFSFSKTHFQDCEQGSQSKYQ